MQRHLAVQYAASLALLESPGLDEAAPRLLRAVGDGLEWDWGALWLVDAEAQRLRCTTTWYAAGVDVAEFDAVSRGTDFPAGVGLPGRVWATGEPIWIADLLQDPHCPRLPIAARAGLRSGFAFPVRGEQGPLGVVEFFGRESRPRDDALLQLATTLGTLLAQFIERKRVEAALRRSEQELTDFFENATIGLHWVGPDGRIERANRAELELLGYAPEEYIGHHIAEFHADREAIDDILARLGRGDELHNYEARLRCKDGSIRHVLISSNVYWQDGAFVHSRCFTRDVTGRKLAEEALRRSEQTYRLLLEQAADAIVLADRDGRLVTVNSTACEMIGYSAEELTGLTAADLIPPEDLAASPFRAEELRAGKTLLNERHLRRKDGSLVRVETSTKLLPDGQIQFIIRDITERVRTQEALQRSEARNRALLAALPDTIFRVGRDGTFLDYQAQDDADLYAPADTIIGRTVRETLPPEIADLTMREIDQALKTGALRTYEYRLTMPDGPREYEARLVPSGADEVLAIIRDITERTQAEAAHGYLAAIVDSSQDAIIGKTLDGVITSWNAGAEQLYGYAAAEVVGQPISLIIPPDRPDELPGILARLRRGERIEHFETVRVRKGGERVAVSVSIAPIRDGAGAIIGAASIARDITAWKRAEAQLRFLAEASTLLASSLDYEATLGGVAELATRALADWCVVDVLGEDGQARRVATAHAREEQAPLVAQLRRYPPDPTSPDPASRALATGQAMHMSEAADEHLAAIARDAAHLALLRQLGLRSYLVVPLVVRAIPLGAITFVATASGRRYDAGDQVLAEELAHRAAIAVDNARLYAAERRARRAAEDAAARAARLQTVTAALSEALTPEQVAAVVVEQGLAALGADAGVMVLLSEDDQDLEVVRAIGYPPEVLGQWQRFPVTAPTPLADAVRTGAPVVVESPEERSRRYPAIAAPSAASDYRALAALPLIVEGRVLGGIGLSFAEPRRFSEDEHAFTLALAHQCAQALERARLYEAERRARAEAERAQRRLAFIAEAGTQLAASLAYETTLRTVARLVVPHLADWCSVNLLEEDGTVARLALTHVDPDKERILQELRQRYLPEPESPHPLATVLRTGQPLLFEQVPDTMLALLARDSEQLRLERELASRSIMIAPLVIRGRTIGAITFGASESGRRFGQDDLALATELTRRAAIAVDNARLYREAQAAQEERGQQTARARGLAEAVRVIAEAQLDLPAILDSLARQVVELVGDTCVIRLLSDDRQWLDVAASHNPDPEARAFGERMVASARERADEGLSGRVVATGEPLLVPVVDLDRIRAEIKPEYRVYLDRFPLHSVLIVPLRVRGEVIGVLSASRETPGRSYTLDDQAFLQDLADRAALAIDNARLYREAREAIGARDQFLSIASHEFRTPVTTIKGYAQLLLRAQARGAVDPERRTRSLEAIDRATDHLDRLTEDLLDVSRLRTGQLILRPQRLDLPALVRNVATRMADRLDRRHRLTVSADDDPGPVLADPDRLEQVLVNLLENAAKYSPDGGEIRLTLEPDGADALLAVADQGIGLPPGSAETIFEPFGRAPNAAERQIPGLGLGLYICRDIIERHDGRIWAESAGDGRGTTVHVRLPLAPADEADRAASG